MVVFGIARNAALMYHPAGFLAMVKAAKAAVREYLEESGYIHGAAAEFIALITGVGVSVLVLIFVGVLGGQTYAQSESQIMSINNTEIQNYITTGIKSGFEALSQTGQYMPIVVLAVIISMVLGLVLSMAYRAGGYGGYYGGGGVL